MEEQTRNNPAHLDRSARFMEKLRLQQEAAKATAEADGDRRLRRALLRKFMGKQTLLGPGDLCYYWRDVAVGSAAKLRWRGPATVIMREPGASGPNSDVYWIGHGTVLLRAAPEHLKPAQAAEDLSEAAKDPLDTAKQALQNIRNGGVTNYVDLGKTNKRRREEVESDEEEGEDDRDVGHVTVNNLPPDYWQASDDGRMWTRIHITPRRKLYVPAPSADLPLHLFKAERVTDIRRAPPHPEHIQIRDEWQGPQGDRELHYLWTGTTTFFIDDERLVMDDGYEPTTPMESDNEQGPGEPEPTDDVPISGSGASHTTDEVRPNSASMPQPAGPPGLLGQAADQAPLPQEVPVPTTPMSLEPEPLEEPGVPASITQSEFPVPPQQHSSSSPTSLKLLLNNVPELPGKRHFSSSLLKAMLLCGMNQHGQLLAQNDHLQRMRKWTLSWTWTSFPRLLFLLAGPSKMDSYNSEKFKMSGDFEGTTS